MRFAWGWGGERRRVGRMTFILGWTLGWTLGWRGSEHKSETGLDAGPGRRASRLFPRTGDHRVGREDE